MGLIGKNAKNNIIIANGGLTKTNVFNIQTPLSEEILVNSRKEIVPAAESVVRFIEGYHSGNIFVYGPKGSGKTALMKYILKDVVEEYPDIKTQTFYVNCNVHSTAHRALKQLSVTTKNIQSTELWEKFTKRCFEDELQQTPIKTFIILDEVDLMKDPDSLLYNLTRNESFMDVMLILITNKPGYRDRLSPDVQSSLIVESIVFPRYTKEIIKEILDKRAAVGLSPDFDIHNINNLTSIIAHHNSTSFNGDVRIGINTMGQILSVMDNGNGDPEKRDRIVSEKLNEIVNFMQEEATNQKNKELDLLDDELLLLLHAIHLNSYSGPNHEWIAESPRVIEKFTELAKHKGIGTSRPIYFKHFEKLMVHGLVTKTKARIHKRTLNHYSHKLQPENMAYVEYLLSYERKVILPRVSEYNNEIPSSFKQAIKLQAEYGFGIGV